MLSCTWPADGHPGQYQLCDAGHVSETRLDILVLQHCSTYMNPSKAESSACMCTRTRLYFSSVPMFDRFFYYNPPSTLLDGMPTAQDVQQIIATEMTNGTADPARLFTPLQNGCQARCGAHPTAARL